jgi:geranylgeranyl reductase family protein
VTHPPGAGAGPAGLYAADCIARQGWSVAVFEEHQEIGQPVHCTGILAKEAFRRFTLPQTPILAEHGATRFYSPAGYELSYQTGTPEAVVIDRHSFDRGLATQAQNRGVRLVLGTRVAQIRHSDEGVWLETSQGGFSGKLVILATGAAYHLHRSLGLDLPRQFLHTAQAEVDFPWGEEIELYFGTTVASGSFAWVVPFQHRGHSKARVGLMATKEAERAFARFLHSQPIASRIDSASLVRFRRRPIPLTPLTQTFASRTLVVGDAAGLTKPTTGGGIYYSLLSAELAAAVAQQALLREDYSEEMLSRYEREWRNHCGRELRLGRWFRCYAERLSDNQINDAFQLARHPTVDHLIRESARFNSHGSLILALARNKHVQHFLLRLLVTSGSTYLRWFRGKRTSLSSSLEKDDRLSLAS